MHLAGDKQTGGPAWANAQGCPSRGRNLQTDCASQKLAELQKPLRHCSPASDDRFSGRTGVQTLLKKSHWSPKLQLSTSEEELGSHAAPVGK
jgi:hypothetical protein